MKTWTVLYFPKWHLMGSPDAPEAFSCEAVTDEEAEGKCEEAHPGCTCVWADVLPRGVEAEEAIADYLEYGKPSAVLVCISEGMELALYLRGRLAQTEDKDMDDSRLGSFFESLDASGVFQCHRITVDSVFLHLELEGTWPDYLHTLQEVFRDIH
jgi:hypothetical protein